MNKPAFWGHSLAVTIPLAPVRFSDSFRSTMKTMTVTEAKGVLGRLVDQALKSKPVFIRRGERVVQLVPAVMPEPVSVLPAGALARDADHIAFLQNTPDIYARMDALRARNSLGKGETARELINAGRRI